MQTCRTSTACRIAGIHRDRFNEAVAAGNYECAPVTRPGSSRIFDEDDLVALVIFGFELKAGLGPTVAGKLACRVREALKSEPGAKIVSVLRLMDEGRPQSLENPVIERIEFEISAIRAVVSGRMRAVLVDGELVPGEMNSHP